MNIFRVRDVLWLIEISGYYGERGFNRIILLEM